MRKTKENLQRSILFYVRKLPPIKQMEALDFIKWLWGGPGADKEFTAGEIEKIESLAKKKGGKKFKNWEEAKSYLESMMR